MKVVLVRIGGEFACLGQPIVTLAMKNSILSTFLLISLIGLSANTSLNSEVQLKIQRVELQIEQLKEQHSDLNRTNNNQQKSLLQNHDN